MGKGNVFMERDDKRERRKITEGKVTSARLIKT